MAHSVHFRNFLGRTCTQEDRSNATCGHAADYLVLDGDLPVLVCARHLLDTVEEVVLTSNLTVDDEPLGIIRLRENEND